MAVEIGSIENVTYFADTISPGWSDRGLLIKVHTYTTGSVLVFTTDLGKVKNQSHVEDMVVALFKRDRELHALREDKPPV